METQELIEALKSVNINSESAEAIAREYFRFQYIKLIAHEVGAYVIFFTIVCAVRAVWKKHKQDCNF